MGAYAKPLLIVNPIIAKDWEISVKAYVEELVAGRRAVEVVTVRRGPATIESYFDLGLAAAGVVHLLSQMGDDLRKFGAIVINCFGDPGLSPARELTSVPVLGPGESGMHLGSLLGHRITILSNGTEGVSFQPEPRMVVWGMEGKFGSKRGTGPRVEDLLRGAPSAKEDVVAAARRALEQDGADVLVLGCTGMANLAAHLESRLGVPVVEPLAAAVSMGELLADAQLSHSRHLAYREAPPKLRLWEGGA